MRLLLPTGKLTRPLADLAHRTRARRIRRMMSSVWRPDRPVWAAPLNKAGLNAIWDDFWQNTWNAGNWAHFTGLGHIRTTYLWNGVTTYYGYDLPEVRVNRIRRSTTNAKRLVVYFDGTAANPPAVGETVYFGQTGYLDTPVSYTDGVTTFATFAVRVPHVVQVASTDGNGTFVAIDLAGPDITDAGLQNIPVGTQMFHPRFKRTASVDRAQIASLKARVNEVLADGGYFLWGGPHHISGQGSTNLWDAARRFGLAPVQQYVASEFADIAAMGWPPARVSLAPEGNEPTYWLGNPINGQTYRDWLTNWLYPLARAAFPEHTLVVGYGGDFKSYNGIIAATQVGVPFDRNTLLAGHTYPGVGTPFDWSQRSHHTTANAAMKAKALALGAGGHIWEEFGVLTGVAQPDRVNRHIFAREEAALQGGRVCVWGAKTAFNTEPHSVAGRGTDPTHAPTNPAGLWRWRDDMQMAFAA